MPRNNSTGLTTKQKLVNIPQVFWKYKKIPNSIAYFCDDKRILNLRTKIFVHNNIFGGDNIEDEIIYKQHMFILLGDINGAELVDENDNAFLYNEFCI